VKVRKWYFAINETGSANYERLIRAAVTSCRRNTSLAPICLYHGGDTPILAWLRQNGVEIIRHTVGIQPAILAAADTEHWKKAIASGAYLRIDIPAIEQEDDFVLYTDTDVIFLAEPQFGGEPEFFACAPEIGRTNWRYVNTGVMLINVANMRREHAALSAFSAKGLTSFSRLGRGTYDQGALNAFFKGRWSRLPLELNWKPSWGINPAAQILHFHGPKPHHLEWISAGAFDDIPDIYRDMFERDPASHAHWLDMFHSFERDAGGLMPVPMKYAGFVDEVEWLNGMIRIDGWSADTDGKAPADFRVVLDGAETAFSLVRVPRKDVLGRGFGELMCGFVIHALAPAPVSSVRIFPAASLYPLSRSS
jgi:hypothetical protein